jgi:elongation factor P
MSDKINVNDFKPGITFKKDKDIYIVIESSHSKSGRGQAHVKCKVKNLLNNTIQHITFVGGEKVDKAFVKKDNMQFLYLDDSSAFFMNDETFEQIDVNLSYVQNELKYMHEGLNVQVISYEDKILGIELPSNVQLTVIEAPDAVKGDTVTNATKKIKLETGIEIDAPQFISVNQKIIVNTNTGKYVGKV